MHTTPASLLQRLRGGPADELAWTRFTQLYTPLIYNWSRRLGLNTDDAADLVQDVLSTLVCELPRFDYDQGRSFRSWLRTVTLNRWRNNSRRRVVPVMPAGGPGLEEFAAPDETREFEEAEYRQYLIGRALELMQAEFQPTTWKACCEHIAAGRSAAEVGADLGLSEGAVYVASSRVLRRLRQELTGLLD
jgi:RNA polymerase sigma-70 factor (ECF subfamily)